MNDGRLQAEHTELALSEAADAAELIASGRIADAQMRFNKKPKRKKKEEAKLAEQSGEKAEAKDEKGSARDE